MFIKVAVLIVVVTTLLEFSFATEYSIKVPPECKDQEICYLKPDDYPSQEIDNIVKEIQKKSNFTLVPQLEYSDEDNEVLATDDLNCRRKVEIITPYLVKVKDTWKHVVQSPYFSQKIREVKCYKEGASCMQMDNYLSIFRKTATCVTKSAAILIQIYEPVEKVIKNVYKLVAACCGCNIRDDWYENY